MLQETFWSVIILQTLKMEKIYCIFDVSERHPYSDDMMMIMMMQVSEQITGQRVRVLDPVALTISTLVGSTLGLDASKILI